MGLDGIVTLKLQGMQLTTSVGRSPVAATVTRGCSCERSSSTCSGSPGSPLSFLYICEIAEYIRVLQMPPPPPSARALFPWGCGCLFESEVRAFTQHSSHHCELVEMREQVMKRTACIWNKKLMKTQPAEACGKRYQSLLFGVMLL